VITEEFDPFPEGTWVILRTLTFEVGLRAHLRNISVKEPLPPREKRRSKLAWEHICETFLSRNHFLRGRRGDREEESTEAERKRGREGRWWEERGLKFGAPLRNRGEGGEREGGKQRGGGEERGRVRETETDRDRDRREEREREGGREGGEKKRRGERTGREVERENGEG
jgi:hypothetical protein